MNLFAVGLVVLFAGSGIYAAFHGRYNEAIYSISAAILNYAVYFQPFPK